MPSLPPEPTGMPSLHQTPSPARRPHGLILLLFLTILCVYAETLYQGAFQFDDYNVILGNPGVHSLPAWFHTLEHGIRPLLKLSYTVNWITGDGEILPFHLTNLLIHLLNTALVFRLSSRFIENHSSITTMAHSHRATEIALLSAAIFALHPIQTETISYISGRSSALMTLFHLAGLLHHENTWRKGASSKWLTPLLFLLALASKETAITFPAALLLWDITQGRRPREALRHALGSWLLLLGATLYVFSRPEYIAHLERSLHFNTLPGNLASNALGMFWLLRQWWLPLWPNIDPDLPLRHHLDTNSLLALSLLAGLLLLTIRHRARHPGLFLALGWFILQTFPLHLLLPRLDIANERQMTLAAWPMALLLAATLSRLPLAFRRILPAMLLLAFASLTMMRNHDYRSEIALWQATAQQSPNKARVHNNLGYAYAEAGRTEEARTAYLCALHLDPQDLKAWNNLNKLPPPKTQTHPGKDQAETLPCPP